jgi:hypothetical protein
VIKIFEQYSQNKDLDIVYNNIDIKYDSSETQLIVNFMNKIFEIEKT